MIEMLKRHEIQVLRRAEHTYREIAALSGVPVRTVRRIAAETEVTSVDNDAERARRRPCIACMDFRSLSVEERVEILTGGVALCPSAETTGELIDKLSEPSQERGPTRLSCTAA